MESKPFSAQPVVLSQNFSGQIAHFTACDACRKRKKKCDGHLSGCAHCASRSIPCVYASKRNLAGTIDQERTDNIDERLRRVEVAMMQNLATQSSKKEDKMSFNILLNGSVDDMEIEVDEQEEVGKSERNGSLVREGAKEVSEPSWREIQDGDDNEDDGNDENSILDSEEESTGEWNTAYLELNVSHHEDHVALGFVSQQHLYIGSKSPFSCFSREGIAWLNTRLGNGGEILALIRISHKIHSSLSLPKWNTDEFVETPELRNLYVEEFFTKVNPINPLFDEHTFRFPEQHPEFPAETKGSSAILLALGAQHLARSSEPTSEHYAAAAYYFKIARNSITAMLLGYMRHWSTDLHLLLGMIVFLLETDETYSSSILLGLATSIATYAGLHRDPAIFGINNQSIIHARINMWWILYTIDRDESIRTGRMSAVLDWDSNVPLPPNPPPLFLRRICLAKIITRIIEMTQYSTAVDMLPTPPPILLFNTLHDELQDWLIDTPFVNRPLHDAYYSSPTWDYAASITRLRMSYLSALTTMHRGRGRLPEKVLNWVRSEMQSTVSLLRDISKRQPRKALIKNMGSLIVASSFLLFLEVLCGNDAKSRKLDDVRVLRASADCLLGVEWRNGEGTRTHEALGALLNGISDITERLVS